MGCQTGTAYSRTGRTVLSCILRMLAQHTPALRNALSEYNFVTCFLSNVLDMAIPLKVFNLSITTHKIIQVLTHSITLPPIIIGLMRHLASCKKLLCISLHLIGSSHGKTDATISRRLVGFPGNISRALVSSTNFRKPPVRQKFVIRHRKEDHTQFGPLGHFSFQW